MTIAHRLGTIATCDCIVVLRDGCIVERGTHAELLAAKGEYKIMWDVQNREHEFEETKEAQ